MFSSDGNEEPKQDYLFTENARNSLVSEAPKGKQESFKKEFQAVEAALIQVINHIADKHNIRNRIGFDIEAVSLGGGFMHPCYLIVVSPRIRWFWPFGGRAKIIMSLTIAEAVDNYAYWEAYEQEYWGQKPESIMRGFRERLLQIRRNCT